MDELPRDARAFLDQARDVHDPPERHAARERVRARLMAALVLPAAVQTGTSTARAGAVTRTFKAWVASSKLLLATAVMVLTSAGFWTLSHSHSRESQAEAAPVPSLALGAATALVQPAPVATSALTPPSVTPLPPSQPAGSRLASASRPRSARPPLAETSLAAETQLLARASAQLAHGELVAALDTIDQHRRRFGAASQLAQERDGLHVLAACLGGESASRSQAQRYIARMPHSVLVPRLELACDL